MFDFPSSPQVGQTHTPTGAGTPTYMWNGTAWDVIPAIASPGTLVEISRQVVTSAVTGVAFYNIDAKYDEYELHYFNVKGSQDSPLALRISVDNLNWRTGASDYQSGNYYLPPTGANAAGINSISNTYMQLGTNQVAAAATPQCGIIKFFQPWNNAARKTFFWDGTSAGTSEHYRFHGFGIHLTDNAAINGVFIMSPAAGGGMVAQGTFILYGRAKAAVAPVPGQRVLLRHIDMAGLTSVDLPLGTIYDTYEIEGHWVANAIASTMMMRCSVDGGATFPSGSTDYVTVGEESSLSAGPGTQGWANIGQKAGHIALAGNFGSSAGNPGYPCDFNIRTRRPSLPTTAAHLPRLLEFRSASFDNNAVQAMRIGNGQLYASWVPLTHVRLLTFNTVTLQAGSYTKLFGGP